MSREVFGCHKWGVLPAAGWYRSKLLLNILKYVRHANDKELSGPQGLTVPRLKNLDITENKALESELSSSPNSVVLLLCGLGQVA